MRYAQIKSGNKLHLVFEAGEGWTKDSLIPARHVGLPLCGQKVENGYRMTINLPLGNACKRCLRVYNLLQRKLKKLG